MKTTFLLGTLLAAAGACHAQAVARIHPAEAAAQATGIASEAWWSATDASGVQQVHIECGTDYLDPQEIVVRRGVPVVLHVRAGPGVDEHEFSVAGHGPPTGIGRSPTAVPVTPSANGMAAMACGRVGAGAAAAAARKQGKLHVVP